MNEENIKQQINLYDKRFSGDESLISGKRIVNVLLIIVASLAVYSGFLYFYEIQNKENSLAELQIKIEVIASDKEQREKSVKKDKTLELEEEVKRLNAEKEKKIRIRKALSGTNLGNDKGFSAHFEGLAKQIIPKIWLTQININNGGSSLGIYGKTINPEYVPRYLKRLSSEAIFTGSNFSSFIMGLPEEEDEDNNDEEIKSQTASFIEFALLTDVVEEE